MATEEEVAIKTTCDGCGWFVWTTADDPDPILGFHGYAMWHGGYGGGDFKWFACSDGCVEAAVFNARQRMWES